MLHLVETPSTLLVPPEAPVKLILVTLRAIMHGLPTKTRRATRMPNEMRPFLTSTFTWINRSVHIVASTLFTTCMLERLARLHARNHHNATTCSWRCRRKTAWTRMATLCGTPFLTTLWCFANCRTLSCDCKGYRNRNWYTNCNSFDLAGVCCVTTSAITAATASTTAAAGA